MEVTQEENQQKLKMKRREVIFGFVCSLLVISMVNADIIEEPTLLGSSSSIMGQKKTFGAQMAVWKEKDVVVVTNSDGTFYRATIISKDYQIKVKILDSDGNKQELFLFDKTRNLVFIGAVQNIILVKELDDDKKTIIGYWVFKIVYDKNAEACKKYSLTYFFVNPYVDTNFNQFTMLDITKILELYWDNQWIAVLANSDKRVFVYKINIKQQLNALIAVSWFQLCGQNILGGNSRVLYDRTANVFLVNKKACSSPYNPTEFKTVEVCKLTGKTLASTDKVKIIQLAGSFFQYFAESQCKKNATTFLYHGYGSKSITGLANLQSSIEIKTKTDNFNFFIAVTDKDIYLSNIKLMENGSYKYFAGLMSSKVAAGSQASIYNIWSKITAIVFIGDNFFFLSGNTFYVFGNTSNSFNLIKSVDIPATSITDKYVLLFSLMKANGYP